MGEDSRCCTMVGGQGIWWCLADTATGDGRAGRSSNRVQTASTTSLCGITVTAADSRLRGTHCESWLVEKVLVAAYGDVYQPPVNLRRVTNDFAWYDASWR